jgi:glycyl-tRNA synthetase
LTQHTKGSGVKLLAARKYKEARPEKHIIINVNKQVVGKEFKKLSQAINGYLDGLSTEERKVVKEQFENEGKVIITLGEEKVVLDKAHLAFEEKIVNVM